MTTSQTIDGVPREAFAALEKARDVLRAIIRDKAAGVHYASAQAACHQINGALLGELRALLDAERCTSCDGSGDLIDLTGEWRGYCGCPAGVALKNKPAAQPQGEPVAWMYRREGGECLGQLVQMESDNLKDVREGKVVEGRRILWPRDDYTDWKPLYAEQPAPVAVLMPKLEMAHVVRAHMEIPGCPVLTSNQCYALAMKLNACLDELKRLNHSL